MNPDRPVDASVHFDYVVETFEVLADFFDDTLAAQELVIDPQRLEQRGVGHMDPIAYQRLTHGS